MKIAFVGTGNLLESMLAGALAQGVPADWMMCSARRSERAIELADRHDIACTTDNAAAAADANLVVVGVTTDALDAVLDEVADDLRPGAVVAVATVPAAIADVEARLPDHVAVVRLMPSVNARVRHGLCGLARGSRVSDDQYDLVRTFLAGQGEVVETDEAGLESLGAMNSGPAYVAAVAQAMVDGAVELGIDADEANRLIVATLTGTAANLAGRVAIDLPDDLTAAARTSPATPDEVARAVGHPGGSTVRSLAHLKHSGALAAIAAAVSHSFEN